MSETPKPKRSGPRLVKVVRNTRLSPNMIRLTFTAPDLEGIRADCEGANCKLMFPATGQSEAEFRAQLAEGPRPATRTYTVRYWRPETLEMDIDFVDHGEGGPASAFANIAQPGDFCGFGGPGPSKVTHFEADWYLVAADMSALPVAAATLEQMPRDARGVAIFEITDEADRQQIDAPEGVAQHWLLHPNPHVDSPAQPDFITSMDWPKGRVQTCIAGESGVIKALRGWLAHDRGVPREDTYISGYWKIGLIEDQHQAMKRAEA